MLHARIAARAFNTPLLVEPSKAMAFLSGLGPRILGRQVEVSDGDMVKASISAAQPTRANLLAGGLADSLRQYGDTPYPVVDGIAVIEISGVLIHRGGWIVQSSGQTNYEGIAAQIEAAASDPGVRGVALKLTVLAAKLPGFLTSQIAFVPFGPKSQSGLLWPNTPSRRAMRWPARPTASSCHAQAPWEASGWWSCTPS